MAMHQSMVLNNNSEGLAQGSYTLTSSEAARTYTLRYCVVQGYLKAE